MASVSNLDEDLRESRGAKYHALEPAVRAWLEQVAGPLPAGLLLEALHDGVVLCRAMAAIAPQVPCKCRASGVAFMQMENIALFLAAAQQLGVPHDELFQTVDLYEEKDPYAVALTLVSVSRKAAAVRPGVPVIGPQVAEKRAPVKPLKPGHLQGKAWSTVEYGYMGGASQGSEGVVFGKAREVVPRRG